MRRVLFLLVLGSVSGHNQLLERALRTTQQQTQSARQDVVEPSTSPYDSFIVCGAPEAIGRRTAPFFNDRDVACAYESLTRQEYASLVADVAAGHQPLTLVHRVTPDQKLTPEVERFLASERDQQTWFDVQAGVESRPVPPALRLDLLRPSVDLVDALAQRLADDERSGLATLCNWDLSGVEVHNVTNSLWFLYLTPSTFRPESLEHSSGCLRRLVAQASLIPEVSARSPPFFYSSWRLR
jgi:hypothetical protein